ncbi:hypothetical protein OBV_p-00540 (plasmid) [Oscillibacter valericigenes Sjm18-20]|nr:hypothetical protein OBV_p-00540 [Oscillibacter valericigenes Sjm18-20]
MFDDLYRLCNLNGYFTCGNSAQYQKMFDMADAGAAAHDVAVVIWICSDDKPLEKIEKEVQEIYSFHRPSNFDLKSDVIR